ncbi:MAG: class I SAM-dependent methyltransferase [Anaerolineales bacterium]|nr:class I SAM-dependent methyltransferase [Anaerolineales bacterium]
MAQDFLWSQLTELPYFRGTLRAVESRWMHAVPLAEPVLDIGSGDGHFASAVFGKQLDIGIDPDRAVMKSAKEYGGYRSLLQSDGARLPFAGDTFASAVSNSVLEHIPHLDSVLKDIGRVLKPGALFAFTVPNPGYRTELSIPRILRSIGLRTPARWYTDWFMRVTRTVNLLDREEWAKRLADAGFRIEESFHYFSPNALAMLEWGHYFGFPCVLSRLLTGKWILVGKRWNLWFTRRYVQKYYSEPPLDQGTYSFYLARKRG